jgi:antitoxin component YwqK of YwqJK toxin-antitoxin module
MPSHSMTFDRALEVFEKQWPDYGGMVRNAEPFCSGPETIREAEKRFHEFTFLEGVSTLFLYGLGSGFDYVAAKQWLEGNPERLLVILEDNFGVINLFLQSELALDLLFDLQVLLVPFESKTENFEIRFPQNFEMILHAGVGVEYFMIFSRSYESVRKEFCALLKQHIHLRISDFLWLRQFFDKYMIRQIFDNLLNNSLSLSETQTGSHLFQKFPGIPTIICAAGPSIQDQLPLIKALKNKALIFGAGTGMNTLNQSGIMPHFGCGMDPNTSSESRIMTNTAFEVPYFVSTHFNYRAQNILHGPKLFFRGLEDYQVIEYFIEKLGIQHEKQLEYHISTTCGCLALAVELGCNPIIFTGLDLSYTDRKRYVDAIKAHPIDPKREDHFINVLPNDHLLPAKNIQGKEIYTRPDWINEGTYYSLFARSHPELKLINATKEGLQLSYMDHASLSEVVEKVLRQSFDLDNWVYVEVALADALPLNKQKVTSCIFEWKRSLEKGAELLLAMIKELLDFDDTRGEIPETLGSEKYHNLKKELDNELVETYLLKDINNSFKKKSIRRQLVLRYHSHHLSPEERYQRKFELELIRLKYFHDFVTIQLECIDSLEKQGQLSEGKSSESTKSVLIQENWERYLFSEGQFAIKDSELELDFREDFSPALLAEDPEQITEESQLFYASMIDGIPEGECRLYDRQGWLKGRWYYLEGKLHGPSIFYNQEGVVLAQGWFIRDERQGKNVQYYPSGRIYSRQRYRDGCLDGLQEYYYENGQPKTFFSFIDGQLEGEVWLYYPNGGCKRKLTYSKGKRHGKECLWIEDGQLVNEAEYDQGTPVGVARKWNASGRLTVEKKYVDTLGHFDLREWNKEGKLQTEQIYIREDVGDTLMHMQKETTDKLSYLKDMLSKRVDKRE